MTRPTPAQDKLASNIDQMTKRIEAHMAGLSSGIVQNREESLKAVRHLTKEREKALKKKFLLQKEAGRKKKSRLEKKKKVDELIEQRPEIAKELSCLTTVQKIGRPIYPQNDYLLRAIQEIAILGCGAEDRRRSELIRSVRTLDDLTDELKKQGFILSRTAVYHRLLPRRQNTFQGKLHVTTVPVKLCRASNDKRSKNPDRWFAAKSMEHAEELASLFGPAVAVFIGQDDKAHVPIGITAANKQAPLLMNVKYEVQLPDHDFVIATKHKLTPTVIGLRKIQDTPIADRKAVRHSGPTLIQVKSLKHTRSNAYVHIEALDEMLKTEEMCKLANGSTKPILILTRDGHDGPRFPSTRNALFSIFKEHDIDFLFCVCNASGLSAYHFIERRMAPLSAALAGVVLPHDHFGSHLDASGNTIDVDLEKKNFQKAGEILCDIWNNISIDNHNVTCSYRQPTAEQKEKDSPDHVWVENHCTISKYCLQIAKCDDLSCCKRLRSNIRTVIKGRFLPGPRLMKRSAEGGLQLANIGEQPVKETKIYTGLMQTMALLHMKPEGYEDVDLPYDLFCPSVQKKLAEKGGSRYQCDSMKCRQIFTSLELAKMHLRLTGHKRMAMKTVTDDESASHDDEASKDVAPIVDIATFMKQPFTETDVLDDE